MQEPIISPWLIYLANVPQTLTFALVVTVFSCVVIVVAAVVFRYMAKDEAKTLKDRAYRYAYQEAEKEMIEEANKREADQTKEVACYIYGLCNNVLDFGDRYKRELMEDGEKQ